MMHRYRTFIRQSALLTLAVATLSAAAFPAWQSLTGRWSFAVVTDNGTGTPSVMLTHSGTALTGTYDSPRGGVRKIEGEVKGDSVLFTVLPPDPDGVPYVFRGVIVNANSLQGSVDFSGMGGATFTATRHTP